MTDIDWSKPVEASPDGKRWLPIVAVMKSNDGRVFQTEGGWAHVLYHKDGHYLQGLTQLHNIRNKPEKLECWLNIYGGECVTVYYTEEKALKYVLPNAIRTAVHMVEADQ